jgi:hypothetical protein
MDKNPLRVMEILQRDEMYKDLTIRCSNHVYRVHRAVVCPQSEFFEKACKGDFRVGIK